MMQLLNNVNLIGDLVNTVPVMIDLAKKYDGLNVYQTLDEGKWVYDLIDKKYNVNLVNELNTNDPILQTDLSEAFRFSGDNNTYMTQSHHHIFGLPTPKEPIRPDLNIPDIDVPVYDYLIAPFGRSAGENEKWDRLNWIALGKELNYAGYSVCALGNSKYDSKDFFDNCIYGSTQLLPHQQFDRPLVEVLNMIKKCRKGVISIVTGISHLCYTMEAKNYLLTNQLGAWGNQPDSIKIETYIPKLTVEEVLEVLKCR